MPPLLPKTVSQGVCIFESNARVLKKPAMGSASKKRVQNPIPVKGNPKMPNPEPVSLALSEHCGLLGLEQWS